jgi:ABC-2 type transport system ATP-binding protein
MAAAIEIEHLTKVFKLYTERRKSVKERVVRFGRSSYQEFHALEDINLTIAAGTTVGLLGHNGSGKSTLLKTMAGIIQPTSGSVRTVGRLAALLELGAGFHPELTGRENVYLNGSILGLKRVEIDRVFDDIVDFSGLEAFIDSPVKHYSSGMYVRLGFAVAINVDPEILLIDEVLSVGDENFQRKCIDKVKSFQAEGRTIVVVTHAAELVRQMCDKAAALDHGRMVAEGDPNDVVRIFRERLMQGMAADGSVDQITRAELSRVWHDVQIGDVLIHPPTAHNDKTSADGENARLHPGDPLRVTVGLHATEPTDDVVVAVTLYASNGQLIYGTNTSYQGADLGRVHGRVDIDFDFGPVPLIDGNYAITVGVHTEGGLIYDSWEQRKQFEVRAPGRDVGIVRCPPTVAVRRASARSVDIA